MPRWYSLNLGDATLAEDALARVASAFRADFERRQRPPGMALFTRHESEGRLHCELVVYFSPEATDIARALGATACPSPGRGDLGFVAGDGG